MSKILTEDLIQERLEENGMNEPREIDHEDRILKIKNHYCFEIVSDWERCDAYFYTDTTADDYEVWIATEQEGNVCINEDVYYYNNQWFEKLADYLRDGCRVYIDSYSQEEYGFEEVIEAIYEEWYIECYEDVENQFIDEGYRWKEIV